MKNSLPSIALFCVCVLFNTSNNFAQSTVLKTTIDTTKQLVKFSWTGYVRAEYFFDSRQTNTTREGDFMFLPAAVDPDANGHDKNAVPTYNSLAIKSRLRVNASGPEFFGFKSNAAIESEFAGTSDGDINGLRLRHAYIQLTNSKVQLLFGQFFHPFWVTECAPAIIGAAVGAPIISDSRFPQFRITTTGDTKIFGALITERDNGSFGPNPPTTANIQTPFLRNDLIPIIDIGLQQTSGNMIFGGGVDFKSLKPRNAVSWVTSNNQIVNTTVNDRAVGISANLYYTVKTPNITFKSEAIFGQNLSDFLLLGGYGESAIDSTTGKFTYTPMSAVSGWIELSGKKNAFEWGVFAGYITNLGLKDALVSKGAVYQQGTLANVMNVLRIAPRVGLRSGKMFMGIELEITSVQRARGLASGETTLTGLLPITTATGTLVNVDQSTNTRVLYSVIYSF